MTVHGQKLHCRFSARDGTVSTNNLFRIRRKCMWEGTDVFLKVDYNTNIREIFLFLF